MESARKRLRYCEHCSQTVTYLVYKKHKEEFYDSTGKQWMVTHCFAKNALILRWMLKTMKLYPVLLAPRVSMEMAGSLVIVLFALQFINGQNLHPYLSTLGPYLRRWDKVEDSTICKNYGPTTGGIHTCLTPYCP